MVYDEWWFDEWWFDEWCMMSGGLTSGDEWCMMSDVNVRNTEVPSKLPLTIDLGCVLFPVTVEDDGQQRPFS